ncbi:unnamed protein product [Peniophora sp. CBMAI 1063]|nr:unnamed protein product [Peniophora sp. CBMAI 1063]
MKLTLSTPFLRDTELVNSHGRPVYSISSSRFGKTTTIERAVEHETAEAETETIGTLHFGSIRSDRIAFREEKEKRVGNDYLCKVAGASEFSRQRSFVAGSGQKYEWKPVEDDWQLYAEGGYGPVAWSSAPSHDWQSGEHLVTAFEIDEHNVRAQDVDEIVVTFVYMQLRQERDVRRY